MHTYTHTYVRTTRGRDTYRQWQAVTFGGHAECFFSARLLACLYDSLSWSVCEMATWKRCLRYAHTTRSAAATHARIDVQRSQRTTDNQATLVRTRKVNETVRLEHGRNDFRAASAEKARPKGREKTPLRKRRRKLNDNGRLR